MKRMLGVLLALVFASSSFAASSKCVYTYIASKGPNTVVVVDTSTNSIVDTIALGGPGGAQGDGAFGLAITPLPVSCIK